MRRVATTTFEEISGRYEQDSVVQKSAAGRLLGLLDIQRHEAVLDLGCGAGNLTRRIRQITDAPLTGVDPTPGMIDIARNAPDVNDIAFVHAAAEEIDFKNAFDVIFCNSAIQWFTSPVLALQAGFAALRPGGRMGMQAPARRDYCPNFLAALTDVSRDPRTAEIFSRCNPSWFFLERADDYRALFEQAGFSVPFAVIEELVADYSPEQVLNVFESGAAAGYLNQDSYQGGFSAGYPTLFREILASAFQRQAGPDGLVKLIFNRVFLIAVKP
jgi:trans-aconitate 2-methyltransferase